MIFKRFRIKKEFLLFLLATILLYVFLYRDLIKVLGCRWIFGELYRDFILSEPFYIWGTEEFTGLNMMPIYLGVVFKILSIFDNNLNVTFYLLIPIISFFLFSSLTRKILSASFLESFIGGLLYSLNPVIISVFIVGEFGPILAYMSQPLIFLSLYQLVVNHEKKWIFAFPIVSIPFFVNIYHAFWSSVFIVTPIFIYAFLCEKGVKKTHMKFKLLVNLFFILLLVQLPLIFQYSLWIFGKPERLSSATVSTYSYQDASFMNIIRLSGNRGSAQANEYLDYNSLNTFTVFGYVITVVAMLSTMIKHNGENKEKRNLYLLNLAICMSYLSIAGLIMSIRDYKEILNVNPIFYSLRNPIKLQCPQALLFSITFECSLIKIDKIVQKYLRKEILLRVSIYLVLVLSIFIYNLPALDGSVGLKKARQIFYIDSYMQENFYKAINFSKRTLVLPWNIIVQKSYFVPNKLNPLTGSFVSTGSDLELIRYLYEQISLYKFDDIKPYLQILDVKYVAIFKNVNYSKNKVYISFDTWMVDLCTSDIMYILENDVDFQKILENDQVIVFELNKDTSKIAILLDYGWLKEAYESKHADDFDNIEKILLEYEKISPTKYITRINASKPFILSFAEPYDPLWIACVNGEKVQSTPIYSTINSFRINQTGHVEITIEYEAQKWFYVSSAISVTTMLACCMYLIHDWIKHLHERYKCFSRTGRNGGIFKNGVNGKK
jgi:hypothetical protein